MTRKYHNHTLQTNPWRREEDAQNINSHETAGRQLMYSNQLALLQRDDCNNTVLISNSKKTKHTKTQTMGASIKNKSATK